MNFRESVPEPPRFFSHDDCAALMQELLGFTSGRGRTVLQMFSSWQSDVRWGRNRIAVARESRQRQVEILRYLYQSRFGSAGTNQLDAESLRAAVNWAERMLHLTGVSEGQDDIVLPPPIEPYVTTHIWSDSTYAQSSEQRSAIASHLISGAERAGMLSAGYLSVMARGQSVYRSGGLFLYAPQTLAECSMTVRDPQGTGSGWAGASSYDWGRFDAAKLAEIALDKCLRSRNPVRIEPGRYTLIMEPQATFELMSVIVRGIPNVDPLNRQSNERHDAYPFFLRAGRSTHPGKGGPEEFKRTKIGQRILDDHISLLYEPNDPDLGVVPFDIDGSMVAPATWVDNGVLSTLAYDRSFAQSVLHVAKGIRNPGAFRMDVSGSVASVDEMIATTKRGLLVTRFWGLQLLDTKSLLCTGMTRDGLWLVENGAIRKPVKNLRWTESPLFAFNNVEQLGTPVSVFSPGIPAMVPPVKVRDFSFTSLLDAV